MRHRPRVDLVSELSVGKLDDDLEKRLGEELDAFNAAATGDPEEDSFAIQVTEDDGELIGGLTAYTWGSLCTVDLLWVREDRRQDGWGRRMLRAAELEAHKRGCDWVTVSTYSFQAPDFYLRYGYQETGRTPGVPGGHEEIHLIKRLGPDGTSADS
ncbi:N-acetyltransferase [Pseudonocardiaceae bacterium YIM PH 21723]|nr:N-acetyltransferase [Pseudonocardiaceae bacterium YIM PH 21723]